MENLFLSFPKVDKQAIKGIIQALGPTAGDCLPVLQGSQDTSLTCDVIKYMGMVWTTSEPSYIS